MVRRRRFSLEEYERSKPVWCRGKRPSELVEEIRVLQAMVGRRERGSITAATFLTELQKCLCPRR